MSEETEPEFSFIEDMDIHELRFELKERIKLIYELREQRDTLIKTLSVVINSK